jgi:hypothetical protein
VLKGVLEEGQFVDDELGAEYLGGVLASSRTSNARDDRAASLVALVSRLSTYQLRAHYVLYSVARHALAGTDARLRIKQERVDAALFVSYPCFMDAMDLDDSERDDFDSLWLHIINGLQREDLLDDEYIYGPAEHLQRWYPRVDFGRGGVVFRTATLGIELFAAAHGQRGDPVHTFVDPDSDFGTVAGVHLEGAFGLLESMPLSTPDTDSLAGHDAPSSANLRSPPIPDSITNPVEAPTGIEPV